VNVTYLTGLGWKRQREIVHQYAQNDRRVLPPTGIPLGNIQAGFSWMEMYQKELSELSFPSDGEGNMPYPFYDRWGDGFNLTQEFVIIHQARALAYLSWLMAQGPLKSQPWKAAPGQLVAAMAQGPEKGKLTYTVRAAGLNLDSARIVWEAEHHEPLFGKTFVLEPAKSRPQWIEAEAQLPDGRRVFAITNFTAFSSRK
jgi:hypothetical protein